MKKLFLMAMILFLISCYKEWIVGIEDERCWVYVNGFRFEQHPAEEYKKQSTDWQKENCNPPHIIKVYFVDNQASSFTIR